MNSNRHKDPIIRRAQRVLQMVNELHKIGYQKLRISPGMSPSGCHWRCAITHVGNISAENGAKLLKYDDAAYYTTGQSNHYFDWKDAKTDTARELAQKFLVRFAEIAQLGQGEDWLYAGWYVQMLGIAEIGSLPVAYADWYSEPDFRWLPTTEGFESGLPIPPGGQG